MTSDLDSSSNSRGDRARTRAYLRDFLPGIGGYLVVLALVVKFGNLDGSSPWRFLWAVLPVIPALWCLRAVARHIGRIDDYQQRLLLKGDRGRFRGCDDHRGHRRLSGYRRNGHQIGRVDHLRGRDAGLGRRCGSVRETLTP
jgi:hypothetical protein